MHLLPVYRVSFLLAENSRVPSVFRIRAVLQMNSLQRFSFVCVLSLQYPVCS